MSEKLELEDTSLGRTPDPYLKDQVLELTDRIARLADNQQGKLDDIALAQETAQTIKPYVDRLVALDRLLNPVDRIVKKRQKIHDLQAEIAEDVTEVENLADNIDGDVAAPNLIGDIQGEISAVRRDRKLFVPQIDEDDSPQYADDSQQQSNRLLEQDIEKRFERIFAERFISLTRLESILSIQISPRDKKRYLRQLQQLWELLFERDEFHSHVQNNRVKSLANAFADYALIFRCPQFDKASNDGSLCSLAALRDHFQSFFVNPTAKGLWYTRQAFFHQSIDRGHWALVDSQYLNCTFKKPSIRLLMYARANSLPAKVVRQKSAVEDVYDRIVLELALRKRFFENCHSITNTSYQASADEPAKQVYLFYKDDSIRISGKSGTPHWKPTKPRWPGVLPSISLHQ